MNIVQSGYLRELRHEFFILFNLTESVVPESVHLAVVGYREDGRADGDVDEHQVRGGKHLNSAGYRRTVGQAECILAVTCDAPQRAVRVLHAARYGVAGGNRPEVIKVGNQFGGCARYRRKVTPAEAARVGRDRARNIVADGRVGAGTLAKVDRRAGGRPSGRARYSRRRGRVGGRNRGRNAGCYAGRYRGRVSGDRVHRVALALLGHADHVLRGVVGIRRVVFRADLAVGVLAPAHEGAGGVLVDVVQRGAAKVLAEREGGHRLVEGHRPGRVGRPVAVDAAVPDRAKGVLPEALQLVAGQADTGVVLAGLHGDRVGHAGHRARRLVAVADGVRKVGEIAHLAVPVLPPAHDLAGRDGRAAVVPTTGDINPVGNPGRGGRVLVVGVAVAHLSAIVQPRTADLLQAVQHALHVLSDGDVDRVGVGSQTGQTSVRKVSVRGAKGPVRGVTPAVNRLVLCDCASVHVARVQSNEFDGPVAGHLSRELVVLVAVSDLALVVATPAVDVAVHQERAGVVVAHGDEVGRPGEARDLLRVVHDGDAVGLTALAVLVGPPAEDVTVGADTARVVHAGRHVRAGVHDPRDGGHGGLHGGRLGGRSGGGRVGGRNGGRVGGRPGGRGNRGVCGGRRRGGRGGRGRDRRVRGGRRRDRRDRGVCGGRDRGHRVGRVALALLDHAHHVLRGVVGIRRVVFRADLAVGVLAPAHEGAGGVLVDVVQRGAAKVLAEREGGHRLVEGHRPGRVGRPVAVDAAVPDRAKGVLPEALQLVAGQADTGVVLAGLHGDRVGHSIHRTRRFVTVIGCVAERAKVAHLAKAVLPPAHDLARRNGRAAVVATAGDVGGGGDPSKPGVISVGSRIVADLTAVVQPGAVHLHQRVDHALHVLAD